MASKRRGVLYLIGGSFVALASGTDEAARLLARGTDEYLAASKGADEAAGGGDEAASADSSIDEGIEIARRAVRRQRIAQALRDEESTASFTLPAGYFAGFELEPGVQHDLEYEVSSPFGQVDVFLFSEAAFQAYESGGNFDSQTTHRFVRTVEETVKLGDRERYYLIVDNTSLGWTEPSETDLAVDITVRLGHVQ
ncbi:hypothetical protein [Haloarchaeobius iranensis]|uniref:Uncharacterized protein n=1 Tax=Haloarchaeobius iranensis TaxID=996166 RepID=A0A1G9T6N4_9EURY|nr:hypothetical protein [Haloarchaeobius iranensis]SDM43298.1 hypothetical protein SAMN05192554_102165 [Haloarchaeobius iranensis]